MRDERLICGIKQDDSVVFERVIDPRFELCSVIHGAGGVIRRAEIDNVGLDVFIRHTEEAVLLVCVEVDHLSAGHDVRIDIHGIDRVRDEDGVIVCEDIDDIADVALCAIADENFAEL